MFTNEPMSREQMDEFALGIDLTLQPELSDDDFMRAICEHVLERVEHSLPVFGDVCNMTKGGPAWAFLFDPRYAAFFGEETNAARVCKASNLRR